MQKTDNQEEEQVQILVRELKKLEHIRLKSDNWPKFVKKWEWILGVITSI